MTVQTAIGGVRDWKAIPSKDPTHERRATWGARKSHE